MEKEIYLSILDGINEGIYFVDKERKIIFWNQTAEKITGFSRLEVQGTYCFNNILNHKDEEGRNLCVDGCPLLKTINDGKIREEKVYLRHKNGNRIFVLIKVAPIYENEKIIGAVEMFKDICIDSLLLKADNKMIGEIFKDELTNIPNRKYLKIHLKSAMLKFQKIKINFGVIFLDIDFFKKINDNYGHIIGDKVLKMIGEIFINCCRGNDLIGRWGGEEFIGIFENLDEKNIIEISNRIRNLVENKDFCVEDKIIKVTISIGATLVKEMDNLEDLLKRADEGVYLAKKNGRNRVEFKK